MTPRSGQGQNQGQSGKSSDTLSRAEKAMLEMLRQDNAQEREQTAYLREIKDDLAGQKDDPEQTAAAVSRSLAPLVDAVKKAVAERGGKTDEGSSSYVARELDRLSSILAESDLASAITRLTGQIASGMKPGASSLSPSEMSEQAWQGIGRQVSSALAGALSPITNLAASQIQTTGSAAPRRFIRGSSETAFAGDMGLPPEQGISGISGASQTESDLTRRQEQAKRFEPLKVDLESLGPPPGVQPEPEPALRLSESNVTPAQPLTLAAAGLPELFAEPLANLNSAAGLLDQVAETFADAIQVNFGDLGLPRERDLSNVAPADELTDLFAGLVKASDEAALSLLRLSALPPLPVEPGRTGVLSGMAESLYKPEGPSGMEDALSAALAPIQEAARGTTAGFEGLPDPEQRSRKRIQPRRQRSTPVVGEDILTQTPPGAELPLLPEGPVLPESLSLAEPEQEPMVADDMRLYNYSPQPQWEDSAKALLAPLPAEPILQPENTSPYRERAKNVSPQYLESVPGGEALDAPLVPLPAMDLSKEDEVYQPFKPVMTPTLGRDDELRGARPEGGVLDEALAPLAEAIKAALAKAGLGEENQGLDAKSYGRRHAKRERDQEENPQFRGVEEMPARGEGKSRAERARTDVGKGQEEKAGGEVTEGGGEGGVAGVFGAIQGYAQKVGAALSAVHGVAEGVVSAFQKVVSSVTPFVAALNPSAILQYNQASKDLQASIGVGLQPILATATDALRTFASFVLPIAEKLAPVFERVGGAFTAVAEPVMAVFSSLMDALLPLADAFAVLLEGLVPIGNILASVGQVVVAALSPIVAIVSEMIKSLGGLLGWFDILVAPIQALSAIFSGVGELVKSVFSGFAGWLSGLLGGGTKGIFDTFKGALESMAKSVILATASIAKAIGLDSIVSGMIQGLQGGEKKDATGLSVATNPTVSDLSSFGRQVMQASLLAGEGVKDKADTTNAFLKDVVGELQNIQKGIGGNVKALAEFIIKTKEATETAGNVVNEMTGIAFDHTFGHIFGYRKDPALGVQSGPVKKMK